MTIQEMHYDFKSKLNKIDSNSYRNMKIPEIDWKLNEAQDLFIMLVAEPRMRTFLGFETSQKTIDDISSIVIDDYECNLSLMPNNPDPTASMPDDYLYHVANHVYAKKDECEAKLNTFIIQHDDKANTKEFYQPSFEWRETNVRFYSDGIKIFTNNEFEVTKFTLDYIRRPSFMHYASGFSQDGYKLPGDTTPLTGSQNCELPEHTHREIVDLAVLIATGDLELPTAYQFKIGKTKLTQLINS